MCFGVGEPVATYNQPLTMLQLLPTTEHLSLRDVCDHVIPNAHFALDGCVCLALPVF